MANLPTKNNNPGDLKNPSTGQFEVFDSPQEGYGALLNDLQIKIQNHPERTLADFANHYAPPSDNNNTAQYTANLANKLGVNPDTQIGSLEPQIGKFAEAVASNEGFMGTPQQGPSHKALDPLASLDQPGSLGPATAIYGSLVPLITKFIAGHPQVVKSGLTTAGTAIGSAIAPGAGSVVGAVAGNELGDYLTSGGNNSTNPPTSVGGSQPSLPSSHQLTNFNLDAADKNSKKLFDTYMQSLATTEGGSKLSKDPNIINGLQTTSMFGLAPVIEKNGRQDYTQAIQNSGAMITGLSKQIHNIISTEGSKGDFEEARQDAKRIIRERVPETEWEVADKHIDEAINTYQKNSGSSPKKPKASLERFDKMRSETGSGKKWGLLDTSTKKEAYKAVSRAARHQVENNTKNKELYNATMKMEQHLINGQKVMKKLQGKKAIKNEGIVKSLVQGAGNALGAYVGEKIGGPMGAILGYLVENKVSRAVDKRFGSTIFQTRGMRKALEELQKDSPVAYSAILEELKKHNPTIEQIIEDKGGWNPGEKQEFDNALFKKDRERIKKMLPGIPDDYKQRFKKEISVLLGTKSSQTSSRTRKPLVQPQ